MSKGTVMTSRQFAVKMRVDYRTALNWLNDGIVPGAVKRSTPIGEYWEIPESALKMTPPRKGPRPRQASTKK